MSACRRGGPIFILKTAFKNNKSSLTERQSWFFGKMLQSLLKKGPNMALNA